MACSMKPHLLRCGCLMLEHRFMIIQRNRRALSIAALSSCAWALFVGSVWFGSDPSSTILSPTFHPARPLHHPQTSSSFASADAQSTELGEPHAASHGGPASAVLPDNFNATHSAQILDYVRAIMEPGDLTFPRLLCPQPDLNRYAYLVRPLVPAEESQRRKFMFALNLHQCLDRLPRLIGSIVETIRYLGPKNCVLSIVEGRSDDGTFEVLTALRSSMESLGAQYHFYSSDIDPMAKGNDRIGSLAALRNLVVQDLVTHPERYDQEATVVFSNDVSLCMEDMLELIHQRNLQGADQTCAMDWTYVGLDPTFYDVWIARGMTGDLFFYIPESGSWDHAWNLFWNDPETHAQWSSGNPFQVFACWNGVTVFTAKPLMKKEVAFRAHSERECFQGEPNLFAKDMWYHSYGKIAVIPSVNVGYNDEATTKIKALKGYTSVYITNGSADAKINWDLLPPARVKCMPDHSHQFFVDWDEGLHG